MAEIFKETVTTSQSSVNPTTTTRTAEVASGSQTSANVIYYILGAVEILLAARLILKLTGASPASGFVSLIYTLSQIFIMPFEGIFRRAVAEGVETTAVLEPATIVAMIVYAVLVWGIVKLFSILSGERQTD